VSIIEIHDYRRQPANVVILDHIRRRAPKAEARRGKQRGCGGREARAPSLLAPLVAGVRDQRRD
jgi:hypothetical protein